MTYLISQVNINLIEEIMTELIVVGFEEKNKADLVMLELLELEQEHLVDLEDAVVVTKNATGKIRVKPYYDLVAAVRGLRSTFWGNLIISIFDDHDSEAFKKIGVDKEFCDKLEEAMQPSTSAIFVLAKKVDPKMIIEGLNKYHGKIIRTTVSPDVQDKINNL